MCYLNDEVFLKKCIHLHFNKIYKNERNMKKVFFTTVLTLLGIISFAQKSPVNFTTNVIKKEAGVYDIVITARVAAPWHIYSQFTPVGGPEPTTIEFSKNPLITMVGKTKESGKLKTVYDKNFKTNVKFFEGDVRFTQTIKVRGAVKTSTTVNINYMVCDDQKCLPPTTKSLIVKLP